MNQTQTTEIHKSPDAIFQAYAAELARLVGGEVEHKGGDRGMIDAGWRAHIRLPDQQPGLFLWRQRDKLDLSLASLRLQMPSGAWEQEIPRCGGIGGSMASGPARMAKRALALLAPGGAWREEADAMQRRLVDRSKGQSAARSAAVLLESIHGVEITRHTGQAEPRLYFRTPAGSYVSGRVMTGGGIHLEHATLSTEEAVGVFRALSEMKREGGEA